MSRSHLYREAASRKWKKAKRWLANASVYLIPWEAKIKRIESLSQLYIPCLVIAKWMYSAPP